MYKVCRVKLRPKIYQKHYFDQNFGCCRFVYNYMLAYCIDHHKKNRDLPKAEQEKRPSGYDLQSQLPALKKVYPFLADVDSQALKYAAAQVDVAFRNFFRRLKAGGAPGFPRFKSKYKSRDSFTLTQGTLIKWTARSLVLPKTGEVFLDYSNWSPPDPEDESVRLKRVTLSRTPDGNYYASVLFEDEAPEPAPPPLSKAAGLVDRMTVLDLGLNVFFRYETASGAWDEVESPRFLRNQLACLKKHQRVLSRRTVKSNRWQKQKLRVARIQAKIKQKRRQFLINTANDLVKHYQCLVLEDLKIKEMIQNSDLVGRKRRMVNRAFMDQALGEFVSILEYKCRINNVPLIKIDPLLSPNKICSVCGVLNDQVNIGTVYWTCDNCQIEHQRSANCLKNLRRFAIERIEHEQAGLNRISDGEK